MRLDVVLVVYNQSIDDIKSIEELQHSNYIQRIIICDNSDKPNNNHEVAKEYTKVLYHSMGGNKGLSVAYNAAVKECESEYVLILDDDTTYTNAILREVDRFVESNEADVYLPVVISGKIIMSPCKRGKYRISAFRSTEMIEQPLSAINSGMIVKTGIYEMIHYRDDLFLDMIDHAFMDDVRKNNFSVAIMENVVIHQDYSRETDSMQTARIRYEISKKDNRVFYDSSVAAKIFCEMQLIFWKFKAANKFHSLSPLFW